MKLTILALPFFLTCAIPLFAQETRTLTPPRAIPVAKQKELPPPPEDEFSLELPTGKQLFQIESDAEARQSIRRAAAARGIKRVDFPIGTPPAFEKDTVERPDQVIFQESTSICFRPLYFQDPRTERQGISCGVFEPFRSATLFYGKAATIPLGLIWGHYDRTQCWHPSDGPAGLSAGGHAP